MAIELIISSVFRHLKTTGRLFPFPFYLLPYPFHLKYISVRIVVPLAGLERFFVSVWKCVVGLVAMKKS